LRSGPGDNDLAFRQGLRELGYIEGQNLPIEYRYSEGKPDRAPELAAELVRLKVDVIVVAGGDRWIRAARNATKTIPVIMTGGGLNPGEAGHVESLAHPAETSPALQYLTRKWGGSGWSCSKKPFRKLCVSQFSTGRTSHPMYAN
jgi:putative ABC transport system substrate-binding protein